MLGDQADPICCYCLGPFSARASATISDTLSDASDIISRAVVAAA